MKERKTLDIFNSQIRTVCTEDYVHLYSGIEILADLLGLDILEGGKTAKYYTYYFEYEGVRFLQLFKERMVP